MSRNIYIHKKGVKSLRNLHIHKKRVKIVHQNIYIGKKKLQMSMEPFIPENVDRFEFM